MKNIKLAKKSKRMLARLIDFLMLLVLSVGTFFAITPLTFDSVTYNQNVAKNIEIYKESGLYVNRNGSYFSMTSVGDFSTLKDLTDYEFDFNKGVKVDILKSLYTFYSEKLVDFGGSYNLSLDNFKSTILKVNTSESNIKDIQFGETTILELIDTKKENTTVTFVCSVFNDACNIISNSSRIQENENSNKKIMVHSLIYIIPIIFIYALILELIIPLCLKDGQTIGKKIFKIIVISSDGYKIKKIQLLPRFLAYIFIEVFLGFITFGGTFLISYTMFLFTKKRRCIHDYIAKTCVVDKELSYVFDNARLESKYKEKYHDEFEERIEDK